MRRKIQTAAILVRLPGDLKHRLDKFAERTGEAQAVVVRDALRAYLAPKREGNAGQGQGLWATGC